MWEIQLDNIILFNRKGGDSFVWRWDKINSLFKLTQKTERYCAEGGEKNSEKVNFSNSQDVHILSKERSADEDCKVNYSENLLENDSVFKHEIFKSEKWKLTKTYIF